MCGLVCVVFVWCGVYVCGLWGVCVSVVCACCVCVDVVCVYGVVWRVYGVVCVRSLGVCV